MWPESVPAGIDAIEEVTSADELTALEDEWWELWAASTTATPFQSPAWLLAWWRHFGGNPLCSLGFRNEGRLVGLAPLFIWPREETGERTVLLIGTGITDHLGIVCADGFEEMISARVLDWLQEASACWDVCDFQELHPTSPLCTNALPQKWSDEIRTQGVCPTLAIPQGVTNGSEFLPDRLWKNIRYYGRRLERMGTVEIESVSEGNLADLFEALVRLHGARWASRDEPGMFAEDKIEAFHRDVASSMLAHDLLCMYALRLDGEIVAVYYGMKDRRRAYYYLSGFNPALDKVSPGTQIVAHAIFEAARGGCLEFDFLRGQEAYKYAWGAADQPALRRVIRQEGGSDASRIRSRDTRSVYGAG